MHGQDVEAEPQALAQEITAEIPTQEVQHHATHTSRCSDRYIQPRWATWQHPGDQHAALAVQSNRAANQSAARTRGAGNYVVVSPTMLTVLQPCNNQHLHVQQKVHLKHQQTQSLRY